MRGVAQRRRMPIAVRGPVDIDELALRLLSLTARMRSSVQPNARARAELELLATAIEATVRSTLPLGVDAKALLHEMKWLLYSAEGPFERRMREEPRAIATHVALRRAVEIELKGLLLT